MHSLQVQHRECEGRLRTHLPQPLLRQHDPKARYDTIVSEKWFFQLATFSTLGTLRICVCIPVTQPTRLISCICRDLLHISQDRKLVSRIAWSTPSRHAPRGASWVSCPCPGPWTARFCRHPLHQSRARSQGSAATAAQQDRTCICEESRAALLRLSFPPHVTRGTTTAPRDRVPGQRTRQLLPVRAHPEAHATVATPVSASAICDFGSCLLERQGVHVRALACVGKSQQGGLLLPNASTT
jgi:hypothetical protein